jgi:hypothetical protein
VATGASLIGLFSFYISRPSTEDQQAPRVAQTIASVQQPSNADPSKPALEAKQQQGDQQPQVAPQPQSSEQRVAALNRPIEAPSVYVLDLYPQPIKASILDTFTGNANLIPENKPPSAPEVQKDKDTNSGNLFSLLQNSGQEERSQNPAYSGGSDEPEYSESGDSRADDERREAIRQRFLKAIREAAEHRAEAAEEYYTQ